MSDVTIVLDANRAAIDDFIATAERATPVWETPLAPGKWSPCQITEHVARTLEEGAHLVAGDTSVFPTLPSVLRPLVRGMFFNRVLKKDAFPNARTLKALNPPDGPSPSEARGRLEGALASFQDACRAQAAGGQPVDHPVFGRVSVEDYAKFMELHTEHHRLQLPTAT
ncbi:MAG: DinB family protein [Gemmatimonadales bacterium]